MQSKIVNEDQVNQDLNAIERNMLRALRNDPNDNAQRKWIRGQSTKDRYFLVGTKKTNQQGDAQFSFQLNSDHL